MRPATIGMLAAIAGLLCLAYGSYFGPSRIRKVAKPGTHDGVVAVQINSAPRKVFPLSVIHGGAFTAAELERARRTDAVVSAHYANFGSKPRFEKLSHESLLYVSYRRSDRVYWSKSRHRIPQGEMVISDGSNLARARCGNRLSTTAQGPVGPAEPNEEILNTPEVPDEPVSYKLADLPGPAGRPFNFALAPSLDETPPNVAPLHVPLSSGPLAYNAPGGSFPASPGGFFGGGSAPLAAANGLTTAPGSNSGTSSGSANTSSLSPGPGGTGLPVPGGYPSGGPGPGVPPSGGAALEVAPEPGPFQYCWLTISLTCFWLARRRLSGRILRG